MSWKAAGTAVALPCLAALPAFAADAAPSTPSMFAPTSAPATAVAGYAALVVGICGAIFAVVAAMIAISLWRFRARPGDASREPPQVYGSLQIELAWTVVPVLIVVVLGLVTARTVLALQKDARPEGWMEVEVIGHQWWWELRYPDYGFTTANELHLPLGEDSAPRPTFLRLESQDVIHSFWVPQLSFKTDLIPNRINHLWIDPREPGVFVGQCAEFCGTQHAGMLLRVVVEPPEEFARWARAQQQPAAADAAGSPGRALFEQTACVSCHRVRGTDADGRFGPDLTHLMSRATLAAGVARNDRENLLAWIRSPDHLKPGVRMPAMQLEPRAIEELVDYLVTLH